LLADIAARTAIVEITLEVDTLSSAQGLSGGTASSSPDGGAGSVGTGLIAGTSGAAVPAVGRVGGQWGTDAVASCAEARLGVALRLHLVFDQHVGIGA